MNLSKAFVSVLLIVWSSQAMARPDARRMSCDAIQSLIKQQGSVIFTTGQYTWHTYVADGRYCGRNSRTAPAKIPSADNKKCVVYYECRRSVGRDDN